MSSATNKKEMAAKGRKERRTGETQRQEKPLKRFPGCSERNTPRLSEVLMRWGVESKAAIFFIQLAVNDRVTANNTPVWHCWVKFQARLGKDFGFWMGEQVE